MSKYNWRGYKIYGHGINDLDEVVKNPDGTKCIHYSLWNSVLERCFSETFHRKQPAYVGTTVADCWIPLSGFKYWSVESGLKVENKKILQIDKDILSIDGSKHYSPETCCLVPREVNNILIDRHASYERLYPMGVTLCKRDSMFVSTVNTQSHGRVTTGRSKCPMEAHKAFQLGKAQEIENRVKWWKEISATDPNYLYQENVAQALLARANKLREDAAKGIETFKI